MDSRPIGMFDSGIGGLTVYKEIRKNFPNENIIYLGDTKNFPYGNKPKKSIIDFTKKAIDFLVSKNVKAVIIACGTATSQALDVVKSLYSIPIIGIIEPTAKYLAEKTNIHNVGIVATSGTIKSNSWANFILKYNPSLNVLNKACPLLAPIAEKGLVDSKLSKLAIHKYMSDLCDVDALVLGCTHYPLFIDIFKSELKKSAEIINVGTIISNNLENILGANLLNSNSNLLGKEDIFLTDTECNFISISQKLLSQQTITINKCCLF